MQRKVCGGCGHDNLYPFLDLGLSPIADAYTATADEHSDMYPLQVAVCSGCRLVQLLEVVDSKILFGTGYSFYSSASLPLSRYHAEYANSIRKMDPDLFKGLLVEIGCNDGDMLRHFNPKTSLGVDPAGGPVAAARTLNLNIIESEFNNQIADAIVDKYDLASVIIANHVLAHVPDVNEVFRGISTLLAPSGLGFIEVQYLQDLLVNNAFDLVYHEHRNFFSLTSLENAARCWGLHIVDAQLTPRQGGSLRVTISKNRKNISTEQAARIRNIKDSEWWLNAGFGAYEGMQGRVERIRTRLWDMLYDYVDSPDKILAGYGAPAKATTLLNFCEIDSNILKYVVDSTIAKQNRFIPGTGIPILDEENEDLDGHADVYLLLAWNYANEIITKNSEIDCKWIIPIPAPVLL